MSEPNGPNGDAGAANGQLAEHADRDPDAVAYLAPAQDPWFEPAPPRAGEDGSRQAEWFLRTGRAGLLPDSVTENWDESAHTMERPETAAEPPWAGDRTAVAAEAPPPWESGPWPGPGESRPDPQAAPAAVVQPGPQPDPGRAPTPADTSNWQATAALATGILPVVVPGVVLGILGLRRAAVTGTGRIWSWLGIALSAIWAIVLIVYLAASGGGSGQACGSYQSEVNHPVAQVLRDLASNARESVLGRDLHQAIRQANSAAAAAQDVTARNAMVSLTAGLQQALTTASAPHAAASYAVIRRDLAADAGTVASACKA